MKKHFNDLSAAEDERLACLAEELAEVIQVICKIQRHGYASKHPADLNGMTNRKLLEKELGDVEARICLMVDNGDIHRLTIEEWAEEKYDAFAYLHHQKMPLPPAPKEDK